MGEQKNWIEYFKLSTPFILLVLTGYITVINKNIETIDNKISVLDSKVFIHLSNHDLHPLKSSIIEKAEFSTFVRNYERNHDLLREENIEQHKIITDAVFKILNSDLKRK